MASQATLERLCAEFDTPNEHIHAAVLLLEQNATPAYLARYRRFELGNLPEERLTLLAERLHLLSELEQRRAKIIEQAAERGRGTEELEATLANTADQDLLDDYYQSMRPRRRGIAMQMEEKGLAPLALAIQHRQFGDAAILTVPVREAKPPHQDAPADGADAEGAAPAADGEATATAAEDAASPTEADANPTTSAASEVASEDHDEARGDATRASEQNLQDAAAEPLRPAGAEAAAQDTAGAPTGPDAEPPETAAESAAQPAAELSAAATAGTTAQAKPEPQAEAPSETPQAVPDVDLRKLAEPYVAVEHELPTAEAALEGALLILADRILHDPTTRAKFREELRRGVLRARPVNPDGDPGKYKQFFDFAEPINRIPANRMLALRRAEREKILRLDLGLAKGRHRHLLHNLHAKDAARGTQLGDFYDLVFDSAAIGLQEVCGNDVRRRLKEKADRESMRTYSRNLRSQLLAPPLGSKKVLAIRTSGKAIWAVVINEDGSVGEHKTMPTDSDEQKQGAIALLVEWIQRESPHAIAVPHGRRQAGSEKVVTLLREALGETPLPMVVPVDEAASTIFATSTGGKKAIPGVEVGVRTAISLGRRLQDPLLELARMEVRTLGLGQTLDDVHQGTLQRELGRVKSSCLAEVGCDLNTSPAEILQMIPGLGHERAQALVKHRKQKGGFQSRRDVLEVESINEVCYRNIIGFLRLTGGSEPMDATPIHPDDYELVQDIASHKSCEPAELIGKNLRDVDADALASEDRPKERIIDVLHHLQRAGEDSRGELIAAANEGVNTLADLHQDKELRGRIASLTEFGAFVDLGIGQDGLVHISQIPGNRMRDPNQMLRVGEVVTVWVLGVDLQKQKIALSMHQPRQWSDSRHGAGGDGVNPQQGRRRGRGQRGPGRGDGPAGRGPGGRRGNPGGGRDRGGERGFGGRDRDGRRGGTREPRIYTVEPAREVEEQRSDKGEVTSLSSLRNLLNRGDGEQKKS